MEPFRPTLFVLAVIMLTPGCHRIDGAGEPAGTTSDRPDGQRRASPQARTAATEPTGAEETPTHEKLYGTWVARDVDSKLGEVKVRLTFRREGPVKIVAWSDIPFVGKVRDKTAPYEVHGNTISSGALRGGTSVQFRFDGGDLIIEYKDGKTVRFKRQ